MKMNSVKRQKGQALPIVIAAMMATVLLALVVFNTGQVTSEKMRLTNTADAAAYSGMLWQARALNFHGYTNRAMVANQVAIAQVVSFVSWSKYLRIASRNLNNTIGWVPVIRPFTQAFYNFSLQVNNVLNQIADVAVPAIDFLIGSLSVAQETVHIASVAATVDIVNEVVRRNDPSYEVTTAVTGLAIAENTLQWLDGFTSVYDSNAQLQRKAGIIMSSRDKWTSDRGWDWRIFSLNVGVGTFRIELVKEGETRLLSDTTSNDDGDENLEWEWKGKDTLSIHTSYPCWKRFRGWRTCRFETPIGWGAAFASTNNSDIEPQDCSSWFCRSRQWGARNRNSERRADSNMDNIQDAYEGVRSYREITDLSEDNKKPTLGLAIEVKRDNGAARTSSQIDGIGSPNAPGATRNGMGAGIFAAPDRYASNEMSAIGKAEVYFRRPVARTDGQDEYGNLFNPYWDVHLVSAGSERLASWVVKLGGGALDGGMF